MSGDLIRRNAHPLDERKHNKEEREVLRRERFEIERARGRQFDLARKADEESELAALLGSRIKGRMTAAEEQTRLLLSLHPDNIGLEMKYADVDRLVNAVHLGSLLKFGQDA